MSVDTSARLLCRMIRVMALVTFIVLPIQVFAQPGVSIVKSVDFNNTGTKIAVGHDTGLIEVIDTATGHLLQSFQLSTDITAGVFVEVAWSPQNSNDLAVAISELDVVGIIHILNAVTGQEILTLKPEESITHGESINSITWKPDGSRIAGAVGFTADPSTYRYVTIWDTITGQKTGELVFSPADILSLDWSPDGSRIAAGGGDNNITIWNANTGAVVNTLVGHTYGVFSVSWSPDGSKIASSSSLEDRTIRIWDVNLGQNLLTIPSGAFDIAWSPDGTHIAAPSLLDGVLVWDAATGDILELIPWTNYVEAVTWSPDGRSLAIGDASGTIRIIQLPITKASRDIQPTVFVE